MTARRPPLRLLQGVASPRPQADHRADVLRELATTPPEARRFSWRRGRAPTNAELLAAAQTLLTLGALLAVVLLILMGIGQ